MTLAAQSTQQTESPHAEARTEDPAAQAEREKTALQELQALMKELNGIQANREDPVSVLGFDEADEMADFSGALKKKMFRLHPDRIGYVVGDIISKVKGQPNEALSKLGLEVVAAAQDTNKNIVGILTEAEKRLSDPDHRSAYIREHNRRTGAASESSQNAQESRRADASQTAGATSSSEQSQDQRQNTAQEARSEEQTSGAGRTYRGASSTENSYSQPDQQADQRSGQRAERTSYSSTEQKNRSERGERLPNFMYLDPMMAALSLWKSPLEEMFAERTKFLKAAERVGQLEIQRIVAEALEAIQQAPNLEALQLALKKLVESYQVVKEHVLIPLMGAVLPVDYGVFALKGVIESFNPKILEERRKTSWSWSVRNPQMDRLYLEFAKNSA